MRVRAGRTADLQLTVQDGYKPTLPNDKRIGPAIKVQSKLHLHVRWCEVAKNAILSMSYHKQRRADWPGMDARILRWEFEESSEILARLWEEL